MLPLALPPAWTTRPALIKSALYVAGMIPAVAVIWLALDDRLGADPVKKLEHELGEMALRFLIAGLAITPLRKLTGINLVRYRRALGLLAFAYALLHVLVWLVLDRGLVAAEIWKDLAKRPYIMVGMVAFLILIPLAVTSNATMIKRMGAGAWQRLHKWVYLAVAAGCVHFIMAVKAWPPEPLVYAAITALLLGWRAYDAMTSKPKARRVAAVTNRS